MEKTEYMLDDKLLPIGSVVKLKHVKKVMMIYGRHQMQVSTKKIYDYIAVPYPEGNVTREFNAFFNQVAIEKVLYVGYLTDEEIEMREKVAKEIAGTKE